MNTTKIFDKKAQLEFLTSEKCMNLEVKNENEPLYEVTFKQGTNKEYFLINDFLLKEITGK